jgi:lipopolysaccharide/colanic/teichoic acid biosynthesis glycosyltransferase
MANEEGLTNVSEAVISPTPAVLPETGITGETTTFPPRSVTGAPPVRGWRRITPAELGITGAAPATHIDSLGELSSSAVFTKRAIDLVGSTLLLILLAPLFLVIGLAIKITDPSAPVFYSHRRVGKGGRPITVIKFRSMDNNFATGDGAPFATPVEAYAAMGRHDLCEEFIMSHKVARDPRVTTIGRFLRRTSLDELPQLVNVVRGDMSLVGPRPTSFDAGTYELWQTARLDFRPGITGPWQVDGRTTLDFEGRCRLEIGWFREPSLRRELWLLLRTIGVVIRRTGVA